MRYFRLNILGDAQNRRLAFVDAPPEDLDGFDYKMSLGERIGDRYPDDPRIYLQPKSPGIELADLIGNTVGYLLVSSKMKALIESHDAGEVEYLPFTLYNHKNRVHSTDYWIINPVGTHDVLNREASDIRYVNGNPAEDVVAVRTFVFKTTGLDGVPDLFRIPEDPKEYFVTERLARAFHAARCSNVYVFNVDQA